MKAYEFQVLKGSSSDVYFNAKEKGKWKKINIIYWLWLTIINRETRIVEKFPCNGCAHNDTNLAEKNFYSNHCTLWDCQMTEDRGKCKYKKNNKK